MPVQRILLIVAVLVSWLGPLASGHAKISEKPDSLNLGAAPSEPHEVRVGVQVRQIKFVNQKAENFGGNREGGKPADLPKQGYRPDLTKRGAIRSVFDGRYKLNRYFSPQEHHTPRSLEELYANNDVELFDHESDPQEIRNLAADGQRNGDLLVAMNDKLNALIESEVGEDTGQMLPGGAGSRECPLLTQSGHP